MKLRKFVFAVALVGLSCAASPGEDRQVEADLEKVVASIVATNRGASSGEEIPRMAGELENRVGDRKVLLADILDFMAEHPGNEPAMASALLIDFYRFTDDEKLGTVVPRLAEADAPLLDALWQVLGTVGRPAGDTALPDARDAETLARHPAWWGRLYAVHLLRVHPALRSPEAIEALCADPDDRVRAACAGLRR